MTLTTDKAIWGYKLSPSILGIRVTVLIRNYYGFISMLQSAHLHRCRWINWEFFKDHLKRTIGRKIDCHRPGHNQSDRRSFDFMSSLRVRVRCSQNMLTYRNYSDVMLANIFIGYYGAVHYRKKYIVIIMTMVLGMYWFLGIVICKAF